MGLITRDEEEKGEEDDSDKEFICS